MNERINKPKVFLSHSKKDISFIKRLYDDLVKCKIEPWLDTEEIRHGTSWLDAIFEDGIPTCDSIIVYLTEQSISSPMVKKEMDVSIIKKINDNGISFLPYVEKETLRKKLRSDLQSLHIPVWNGKNYKEFLPKVLSEIWISYLRRTISKATQNEKTKRLEIELEYEKMKKEFESEIFTKREEKKFNNIYNYLDHNEEITISYHSSTKNSEDKIQIDEVYLINVKEILSLLPTTTNIHYNINYEKIITREIKHYFKKKGKYIPENIIYRRDISFTKYLLLFGFLRRGYKPPSVVEKNRIFPRGNIDLIYTEKYERFKYWLTVKDKLSGSIFLRKIK